jgi:hypothetical protein
LLNLRGEYFYHSQDYDAALRDWKTTLQAEPESAAASLWLGRIRVLGPARLRDPGETRRLAQSKIAQGDPDPAWMPLLEIARVQMGESTGPMELKHFPIEWQALVAHVYATDFYRRGLPDRAEHVLAGIPENVGEHARSIPGYIEDELTRLRREVDQAQAKSAGR